VSTLDDDEEPIAAFLEGRLPLELAARALSRQGQQFYGIRGADDPNAPPEILAATTKLRALMARVSEIVADEELIERSAHAPRVETWEPPSDPTNFCLSLEVVISGRDRRRSYRTSMRLYVCTATWLDDRVREGGPTWTPAPLIVRRWNANHVEAAIATRVASAPANTWVELLALLSRIMEAEA
jgi:hypothetical protein